MDPDSGHPTPRDDPDDSDDMLPIEDVNATPTKKTGRFALTSTPHDVNAPGFPECLKLHGSNILTPADTHASPCDQDLPGPSSSTASNSSFHSATSINSSTVRRRKTTSRVMTATKILIAQEQENLKLKRDINRTLNESRSIADEKDHEISTVKEEAKHLQDRLSEQEQKLTKYETELSTMNDSLRDYENKTRKLEVQCTVDLQAHQTELQETREQFEQERQRLNKEILDAAKASTKQQEEIIRLKERLATLDERLLTAETANGRLRSEKEEAADYVDQLQKERAALLEEMALVERRLADAQRSERELGEKNTELDEKISQLKDENQLQAEKIRDMTNELIFLREEQVVWSAVQKDNEQLKTELDTERREMERVRGDLEDKLRAEGDMDSRLADARTENSQLLKELDECKGQLATALSNLKEVSQQNQTLTSTKKELIATTVTQQSTVADLNRQLDSLQRELSSIRERNTGLTSANAELEAKIAGLNGDIGKLEADCDRLFELETINQRLSTEVDFARKELLQRPERQLVDSLTADLRSSEHSLETLRTELAEAKAKEASIRESADRVNSLHYEISVRDQRIEELKQELKLSISETAEVRESREKERVDKLALCDELTRVKECADHEKLQLLETLEQQQARLMQLERLDGYPGQQLSLIHHLPSPNVDAEEPPPAGDGRPHGDASRHGVSVLDVIPESGRKELEQLMENGAGLREVLRILRNLTLCQCQGFIDGSDAAGRPPMSNPMIRPESDAESVTDSQVSAVSSRRKEKRGDENALKPSPRQSAAVALLLEQLKSLRRPTSSTNENERHSLNVADMVVNLVHAIDKDFVEEDAIADAVRRFDGELDQFLSVLLSRTQKQAIKDKDREFASHLRDRELRGVREVEESRTKMSQLKQQQKQSENEWFQREQDWTRREERLRQKLQHYEQNLFDVQAESDQIREEMSQKESQLANLIEKLRDTDKELEELKGVVSVTCEEYNAESNRLHEQLRQANAEVESLHRELLTLESERDAVADQYQHTLQELNKATAKISELRQRLAKEQVSGERLLRKLTVEQESKRRNQVTMEKLIVLLDKEEAQLKRLRRRNHERQKLIDRLSMEAGPENRYSQHVADRTAIWVAADAADGDVEEEMLETRERLCGELSESFAHPPPSGQVPSSSTRRPLGPSNSARTSGK